MVAFLFHFVKKDDLPVRITFTKSGGEIAEVTRLRARVEKVVCKLRGGSGRGFRRTWQT